MSVSRLRVVRIVVLVKLLLFGKRLKVMLLLVMWVSWKKLGMSLMCLYRFIVCLIFYLES